MSSDNSSVILSAQCRAARALLRLQQSELSEASGVSVKTIADFEADKRTPYARTLRDIREALEGKGGVFLDENGNGPGVALKKGGAV